MNLKILISGGTCSGKSTLTLRVAEHTGYPVTSFGLILRRYANESNFPLTVGSLQKIGQELINRLGYDGFLQWTIEHSPQIQWNGALVVDGIRHVAMHESITRMFPTNVLVYCVCDKQTQLERFINRDSISIEEAERIVSHPLEQFVSEFEHIAHLLFRSGDSTENFLAQLQVLIKKMR